MLIRRVQRRLSRELASRLVRRESRLAVQGRYVSFCFDDYPQSADLAGAAILERAAVRGTYYYAAGLSGEESPVGRIAEMEAVRNLHLRGHQIGCHTFGHRDCTTLKRSELISSLTKNQRAVDFCKLDSFAFPFGYLDWGSKVTVAGRFHTVRTGIPGLNQGRVDLIGLKSVPLYEPLGSSGVDTWLNSLAAADGWLIFFTHDVEQQPSRFGCTPSLLEYCVQQATARGYQIETVGQVAARLA